MLSSETITPSADSDGTPYRSPGQSPKPQTQTDKQVNPLEKIEQLLTCSICLERYKNPKLLPCGHNYCLPCLHNYVDTVHHNLKCPECRADHAIPFDGAKGFPTNLTLTGFLDIHLEATDDNAEQIEAYISRYNMERCKICDEKAELDICHHCDRKTCKECRNAHMEMLKRDLGRMLNQVRRLANRIKEASDGVTKNIRQLDINVQATQMEIKEYFQRYQSELKKREEHFNREVELFKENEHRLMKSVKDVLEAEQKNLADSCTWVESALSGNIQVKDEELCRYKTVFVDGVENLRSFQPDSEDYFSKKIRFSPGDDAAKLPTAICNFGELTVSLPQFSGRYLPLEQHYLPKPLRLGLESDSYKTSYRTSLEETSARIPRYKRPAEDTFNSPRSRRPIQIDEDSASSRSNRLRVSANENERSSPSNSGSNQPSSSQPSILGRSQFLLSNQTPAATIITEVEESANNVGKTSAIPSGDLLSRRVQNRSSMILPEDTPSASSASKTANKTNASDSPPTTLIPTRKQKFKIICRSTSSNPPVKLSDSADSLDLIANSVYMTTGASNGNSNTNHDAVVRKSSDAYVSNSSSNYPSSTIAAAQAVAQTVARLRSQNHLSTLESNGSQITGSSSPTLSRDAWLERRRQKFLRSKTNPDIFGSMNAEDRAKLKAYTNKQAPTASASLSARVQQLLSELEFKNSLAENSTTPSPRLVGTRSERPEVTRAGESEKQDTRSRFARRVLQDRELSTERARSGSSRFTSSLLSTPLFDYGSKSKPRLVFGRRGDGPAEMNWPRGIAVLPGSEFAVCDSANHRICIFNKNGKLMRRFGSYGLNEGQFNGCAGIAYNRNKQQIVVTDRFNNRIEFFDLEGNFIKAFGGPGSENGKFKEPMGIALDELGLIYVVDKGNNRIQVFDQTGHLNFKFGSKGDGIGQFNHPLYISIHRRTQNIFITDSKNNRVCVYDHDGVPILSFGTEGFHAGQLRLPRGLTTDEQGFVVVADSGNNRIQVFSPDGKFVHGFGTWGVSPGQLKGVEGIALMEADQQIVVSDRENHRIQCF